MIESEIKREQLIKDITHWCENTKVKQYLRDYDIPSLASTILDEFYHVVYCCGHKGNGEDGVLISFKEFVDGGMGEVQGEYCKDCAERYVKDLGAKIIKI